MNYWEERFFSEGYFKALLDIKDYFTRNKDYDSFFNLNSKKKYKEHIFSFIDYLLSDSLAREEFAETGGRMTELKVAPSGEVIEISRGRASPR